MKLKTHIRKKKKAPSSRTNEAEDNLLQTRPFGDDQLDQQRSNQTAKNEQEEALSHNFSQVEVSDRTAGQPKVSLGMADNNSKFKVIKDKGEGKIIGNKEIVERLQNLPDWTFEGARLNFVAEYSDTAEMENFVNSVKKAEWETGHKADMSITENKVSINLITQEFGGLTKKDFELAQAISKFSQQDDNNSGEV